MNKPPQSGISVIITTYNPDKLEICLDGFYNQLNPPPFEICLVNDGGTEFKIDHRLVRQFYLGPPSSTFRLAKARNYGAKQARYNRLVFTDQDCVPDKNFISGHYNQTADLTIGLRRRIPIELVNGLRSAVDAYTAPYIDDDRMPDLVGHETQLELVKLAFGCNLGIRTSAFWTIGGFDENFVGWGFEDLDLAARLYHFGYGLYLERDLLVYHLDHHSRSKLDPSATARNRALFLESLSRTRYLL